MPITGRHRWLGWALGTLFVLWAIVWPLASNRQILSEYWSPTTVETVAFPSGCVQTDDPPPPKLMRVVEQQRDAYALSLQTIKVCRTAYKLSPSTLDLASPSYSPATGKRCGSGSFAKRVIEGEFEDAISAKTVGFSQTVTWPLSAGQNVNAAVAEGNNTSQSPASGT